MIKQILENILPQFIVDKRKDYKNNVIGPKVISKWEKAIKPLPPPHFVKQKVIKEYQIKSGYQVLIETGTYLGEMIHAQKRNFKKLFSIELNVPLYEKAKKRFKHDKHITILQGNSGEIIEKVLAQLQDPAIFWLDGHYSGGITSKIDKYSPILEELEVIFSNNSYNHILLIDDARGFTGELGYPTIEELKDIVAAKTKGYSIQIEDDIIRILPSVFTL